MARTSNDLQRTQHESVTAWLEDSTSPDEQGTPTLHAWAYYLVWTKRRKLVPMSPPTFARSMAALGYPERGSNPSTLAVACRPSY